MKRFGGNHDKSSCSPLRKGDFRLSTFAAFDAIATGPAAPVLLSAPIAVRTDRGLILRNTRRVHFGDGLPPAAAFSHSIPYEHHIRWCVALGLADGVVLAGRRKSKRTVSDAKLKLF